MHSPDQAVRQALEEIGLSQNEIVLYRTTLTLGPRPASTLAKSIRVQRTRVYDLLSSLHSRGLIETVQRNRVRYYVAAPPDRLLSLLKTRKSSLENQLQQLETALPALLSTSVPSGLRLESEVVRGMNLVRETIDELLAEDTDSIVSIGDIEQILRTTVGTSRWMQRFRQKRIERGITLRISLQGPPDLIEERALLRETLFSPDIPSDAVVLAGRETVVLLELAGTLQATRIRSRLFCSVLDGLYRSWWSAVQRIS